MSAEKTVSEVQGFTSWFSMRNSRKNQSIEIMKFKHYVAADQNSENSSQNTCNSMLILCNECLPQKKKENKRRLQCQRKKNFHSN